jgi:hypothetical protein
MKRAQELMAIPIGKLPGLAVLYMGQLTRRYGACGDVIFTAFAHYAQCVEGLVCEDEAYVKDSFAEEFFSEYQPSK